MSFCIKNEASSIPCLSNLLIGLGAVVLLMVIFGILYFYHKKDNLTEINSAQLLKYPDHSLLLAQFYSDSGQVKSLKIQVELVNTGPSIERGLSGRTELGADGMLFVFSQEHIPSFWMKEMQFDLDFVWLRGGQVVELTANVLAPEPDIPLSELPTYSPAEPVDWVLEFPAGSIDQWQVELSDHFVLSS